MKIIMKLLAKKVVINKNIMEMSRVKGRARVLKIQFNPLNKNKIKISIRLRFRINLYQL